MRRKLILQIGAVFGNFTIISQIIGNGKTKYWVKCICGKQKIILGTVIKSGMNKSCGCLTVRGNNIKHNSCMTSEYKAWRAMINRCGNPNVKSYYRYGGRGITVCDRWQHDFKNFINDMGFKPTPSHSIDRINNDGNYEPSNCRWSTQMEQQRNRSSNRRLTLNGSPIIAIDLCRLLNIATSTVSTHLKTKTPEQIVEFYETKRKKVKNKKIISKNGKTYFKTYLTKAEKKLLNQ